MAPEFIDEEKFEQLYVALRDQEGRLYSDKQLAALPDIDGGHRYAKEWKMRKRSAKRLVDFLKKQERPLTVLEVGCGNGWLSNMMARVPKIKVTGIDPNKVEIEQATRVFKKRNLKFIHGAFGKDAFGSQKFDMIVFAASIQYFPSLDEVLKDAFALLESDGRIHVLDTPFYHTGEQKVAAERSLEYFTQLGYPQMAQYYHHHSLKQLMRFKHRTMFDPGTFWNRVFKRGIFYWIKLKP